MATAQPISRARRTIARLPGMDRGEIIRRAVARADHRRATQAAYQVVQQALADGRLQQGPCAIATAQCRGKIQAHHEDHSRPLEVVWLCHFHHSRLTYRYALQKRHHEREAAEALWDVAPFDEVSTRRAVLRGMLAAARRSREDPR